MLYLTRRVETPAQTTASVTLPVDMRVKSRIKVTLNDGRQAGTLRPAGCPAVNYAPVCPLCGEHGQCPCNPGSRNWFSNATCIYRFRAT